MNLLGVENGSFKGCEMFGCFSWIKEMFVVGLTLIAVVTFLICAIWSWNPEWTAFAVVVLIVYGHSSLRNDEAIEIANRVASIEKKLDKVIEEFAKLQGRC